MVKAIEVFINEKKSNIKSQKNKNLLSGKYVSEVKCRGKWNNFSVPSL